MSDLWERPRWRIVVFFAGGLGAIALSVVIAILFANRAPWVVIFLFANPLLPVVYAVSRYWPRVLGVR